VAVIDRSAVVLARGIVASALTLVAAPAVHAQGVTTSGIRGQVRAERGPPIDARVNVRYDATGQSVEVHAPTGRFVIQGLEPGGPYTLTVRAVGYAPSNRGQIHLTLGELRDVDVVMRPVAASLDTVKVVVVEGVQADGGTRTMISERSLDRLPTLNRDLYDFLRLVPQLSTKISLANPGFSAGGMGFRSNNFLINGVSERTLGGGVSSSFAGNRSVPLDAVLEYQALLAPYDVRYGDFAGALVNAVTRSGTNSVEGSAFVYGRNDRLRRSSVAGRTPYEHAQLGVSLGGPIIRDRLHVFVASEIRHLTAPADGPYVGQPAGADRAVPVGAADLERFDALMRSYGLSAGSAGPIENRGPQRNLFARFDLALPGWNSRVVGWSNYGGSEDVTFTRAARDTFSLSSTLVTRASTTRMSALHVHTTLRRAGGGHNELLLSRRTDGLSPLAESDQPIVRVSVPSTSGGLVTLNSGTPEAAQSRIRSSSLAFGDNLMLPLGASHLLTLGGGAERFHIIREGVAGSYGAWSFASLDALALGAADRYDVTGDFGAATTPLGGWQWNAYAGDRWQVADHFSITAGVRADLLAIGGHAPYHPAIDSLFGRRTDVMPRRRPELSPRVGFVWEPSGSDRQRVRGGLGTFAGRYPLAWAQTALSSYGVGGLLRCTLLGTQLRYPPAFVPDRRAAPTSCAGGFRVTPADSGDVDLLDRDLRLQRVARGSLAYERTLPWDLRLTSEALVSRALSDVVLVNLNLAPPEGADPHGRVMYGTIRASGAATPRRRSGFSEVIDTRSVPGGHAYQLSTRLETTREHRSSGWISYSFSRARDVQTPTRVNTRGTVAWSSARVMSGRHDDLTPSTSSNDVPHRVIAAGSWVAPWSRAPTTLSFYYVGESGRPFTYVAYGTLGRGDLNADGSSSNDPVYVPRDAMDPVELPVSGLSDLAGADNSTVAQAERERTQRAAVEAFIARTPCLRRQRGQLLERNSCREPWSNTTSVSLRQSIPVGRRSAELQLDVFNVLNLVNASWGRRREAATALFEHAGQTAVPGTASQPIFRFAGEGPGWTTTAGESAFQLQLAARYRF
jgi:hypothetical protein